MTKDEPALLAGYAPSRLGRRLVLVMLSSSSLIALLITMAEAYSGYQAGVAGVEQRHREAVLVSGDVLVEQMWSLNDDAAMASVRGLVRLKAIDRAELTWEDSSHVSAGDPQVQADLATVFPLLKKRDGADYALGELRLFSSLAPLRREILSLLGWHLLGNFIKSLIVAAVVLYFFHRMATVHLQRIAEHADALHFGNNYKALQLDRASRHRNDELQVLVNAINAMGARLRSKHLSAEEQNRHLQRLVTERTEHLAQANKRLMEESQLATIGSLVAMVAHELRNPLGAIKASVSLLCKRDSAELDRRAIERIERNVERCDDTVEQLRRAGKTSTRHWVELDFGAWLGSYVQLHWAAESGAQLQLDLAEGGQVFVDQFQLELVVRNIFENALQAVERLPDGELRRLQIRLSLTDVEVVLSVQDSGIGMSADVLQRAFDPLFTTKQYGFGMGLALSRNLIRALGGQLNVESDGEMRGARATLSLPRAHLVARETAPSEA